VKFFRVVGVRTGTATNGRLLVVGGEDCGLAVGVLVGVVGGVVFGGGDGVTVAGTGVLGVGVGVGLDLEGGVTVIAGATIPSVRLATHQTVIAPGLMLISFMVSTSRSISINCVTISRSPIDYTLSRLP
jgi:hypothetical protein